MIPQRRAHLRVAAGSDAGRRGKNNEDQFSVTAFQVGSSDPTPALFALVADGIGGHQAGEVAAKIAVEMLCEAVAESDASQPEAILEAAILRASDTIRTQAEENEERKGMGTTVICAWVIGKKLYTAAVGNSRLYLLRGGELRQLNWDHTWVQEAVDAGALTPELARKHPHANVIRRYLGSRQPVEVDFRLRMAPGESEKQQRKNQGQPLEPGDRLLLCSDGLNDMLEDSEIQSLASQPDLNRAKNELIAAANAAGGKDNITVILLEMPGGSRKRQGKDQHRLRLGCTVGGVVLLLVALLAFYFWGLPVLQPTPTPTPTVPPVATVTLPPTLPPSASPSPSPTADARFTATPAPTNTPQAATETPAGFTASGEAAGVSATP